MTDDLVEGSTGEPAAAESMGGEVNALGSSDDSLVAGLPKIPEPTLENAEDAAKWVYHKMFGSDTRPVEPGSINIDFEETEETSMHATYVAHDDPPPPPPDPKAT